ncbi:MAG: type II CRISPR RNA-guided endonuclease Cas9 [Alphaproteobacteria bacterium GM7ARS4]|nr:type II CRISPR RNA-guided endonuclease Cas9 [Alphaproteobacteria bacterium GM7ARS4]
MSIVTIQQNVKDYFKADRPMLRILGLDIGIASIGFALIEMEEKGGETGAILCCNSHIFSKAEQPKTGESLAAPRRLARITRRRLSRRSQRIEQLRRLLQEHGWTDLGMYDDKITEPERSKINPWALRVKGLSQPLEKGELATVLGHLCKYRGFRSTAKASEEEKALKEESKKKSKEGKSEDDEERHKMLEATAALFKELEKHGITYGQYIARKMEEGEKKGGERIRNTTGNYHHTPLREKMILVELKKIWTAQKETFNNHALTDDLYRKVHALIWEQRPIKGVSKMVGPCVFYPKEKRAAKHAPSAEEFVAWSSMNNHKIRQDDGGERDITLDERLALYEKAITSKSGIVTYAQARRILDMEENDQFNLLNYRQKPKRKKKDEKKGQEEVEGVEDFQTTVKRLEEKPLVSLKGTVTMRALFETHAPSLWHKVHEEDPQALDTIASILAFEKDEAKREDKLKKQPCLADQSSLVQALGEEIDDFTGTINLSGKACRELIPRLREGLTYKEACEEAGMTEAHKKRDKTDDGKRIPPFDPTRNPVVDRALAETRKVIHAIVRCYCDNKISNIDRIHIELARDIHSAKERREIEIQNRKNEARNKQAREKAEEIFGPLHENDPRIYKYRLWDEQQRRCLYSGDTISGEDLKNEGRTEIDHALPLSQSFDNSHSNKVLCFTKANQDKGNRTPYEWLGGEDDSEEWQKFTHLVSRCVKAGLMSIHKKKKLLTKHVDRDGWLERSLNNTRYMARVLSQHLRDYLPRREGNKDRVQVRKGYHTSLLRQRWGLNFDKKDKQTDKKQRDDNRHHAIDALVVAASTQSMVQRVAEWKRRARKDDPLRFAHPPWPRFREDTKAQREKMLVHHRPERKYTGEIHEETIKSIRHDKESGTTYTVERRPLHKLTEKSLKHIVGVRMEGDKVKGHNAWLYELLKERLEAHRDPTTKKVDLKKAFGDPKNPLYLQKKNGSQGPIIRSVRLRTDEKTWIPVRRGKGDNIKEGAAQHGAMVRVDVYHGKDEGYRLCPVYLWDVTQGQLPTKLIINGKEEKDWDSIDPQKHTFLFSLHSRDFVRITKKTGEVVQGYYCGTDRATGVIALLDPKASTQTTTKGDDQTVYRVGVKTLLRIQKFHVDYFGNMVEEKEREGKKPRDLA